MGNDYCKDLHLFFVPLLLTITQKCCTFIHILFVYCVWLLYIFSLIIPDLIIVQIYDYSELKRQQPRKQRRKLHKLHKDLERKSWKLSILLLILKCFHTFLRLFPSPSEMIRIEWLVLNRYNRFNYVRQLLN